MSAARTLGAAAVAIAAVLGAACGRSAAPGDGARASAAPHALQSPTPPGSGEPHLALAPEGVVVLSWIEPSGSGHALKYARLDGDRWGAPVEVASGENWYVNAADVPAVQPVGANLWAAHWRTVAENDPYAYDVAVAVSSDGGMRWSAPQRLNDDGLAAEHGFVSLFGAQDGVGAVWLNGSPEGEEEPAEDVGSALDAAGLDHGNDAPPAPPQAAVTAPASGTRLASARLDAGGTVVERGVIDDLVCDCCQTGVAAGAAGELLVYRDRTPDEIRDIFVRRRTAGGWSEPIPVGADHWKIAGCPVNGPAIDARGSQAAVAWFTAADERPHVRFARSEDAGATFGPPVEIDGDGSFGHVGVALAADGSAAVSWWRRSGGGGAELAVRTVGPAGDAGPPTIVAHTSAPRPDDVPQLVRSGGRLVLAWTEAGEPTRIATAVIADGAR